MGNGWQKANFSKGIVMKTLKRILSLVLCLSLVMCFPLSASAATAADEDSELVPAVIPVDESSAFAAGDNTMSSNGTFNFNTRHYVTYLPFTANSSSIWVQTSCRVYNTATKEYITTDRLYFDIDLYKAGTNEKVGGYRGYADGVTSGSYFNVTNGGRYYIKFTPYGLIYNNEYLYGSGLVTPVTYP